MVRMILVGLWVVVLSAVGTSRAHAGLILSVNRPGLETSLVAGVTTESFDAIAPGVYSSLTTAVGTLSSPGLAILPANTVGGAGGSGNFFSVGAPSGQPVAGLTLNGPQSYFGLWWSAADISNQLVLLSGSQVIGVVNTSTMLAALGSDFYGNPNGGGDPGEIFAYVNIFATGNTTFDGVIFVDSGNTGFDSDNWSTLATPPPYVTGLTVTGGITYTVAVPEPASIALTLPGLIGLIAFVRRRGRI